jgi:hypothetical protein
MQKPGPLSPMSFVTRYYTWGVIMLILFGTVALRVHLLDIPLERDEGEYAYAGQLILHGFLPYTKVYNMKMPGIYGAYALLMVIFGQTPTGIHLGLMMLNLATIIFLFLLGKQLLDRTTGVIAAASFAVLSVSPSVQGVLANAEHFVILPAVVGMFILLRAADRRRPLSLFFSGLMFGLAFMMKQHGAAFIAFALVYLIYQGWRNQPLGLKPILTNIISFQGGAALLFTLTCLFFLAVGIFDKFWFWTFTYAKEYVSLKSPIQGLVYFIITFSSIVSSAPPLWVLAGWGVLALFIDQQEKQLVFFIGVLTIFSSLAIMPGFYFRPHYFVLLLPAVSLVIGVGISTMGRLLVRVSQSAGKLIPVAIIFLALLYSVYHQRLLLFGVDPATASRLIYSRLPYERDVFFPESLKIGQYLKEHTSREDAIAVLGSEPQIYFYAHRRAATGYIYGYPLMEPHQYAERMQEEMIREIEVSRPAYLVLAAFHTSWAVRLGSPRLIFDWFRRYSSEFYDCVGVIDGKSFNFTEYHWDKADDGDQPRLYCFYVFKRKPN